MYQQRAVISRHINIYCCKGRRVCSNVTVDGDQTTFAYHCSQPSSDAEILTRYSYSVSIRLFLSLCADAKLSQPRPRRCHVMLIHKILPARFWPHTTAIIVFSLRIGSSISFRVYSYRPSEDRAPARIKHSCQVFWAWMFYAAANVVTCRPCIDVSDA